MYGRESIILETDFRNTDFDEFMRFEIPLYPEIKLLAEGLYVCVLACYHNSKTHDSKKN